jgi:photosystem II stability/assembly factor-like uncharacterized protein
MSAPVPGTATAQKLVYEKTVHIDLDNNEINLADSSTYGHRVVIEVPRSTLDTATVWQRPAGSLTPVGSLNLASLQTLLNSALSTSYVDLDGQGDGLNFSSSILNTGADGDDRLRADPAANTVNDWVMAYVLYKLYGKSSFATKGEVFNIEDVRNMLTNVTVSTSIKNDLSANTPSVEKLFKDLLTSDPKRFFDQSGAQLPGLFETNVDGESAGSWQIAADDIIEIRIEFEFAEAITRRNVADSQLALSSAMKEIAAGEKFYMRLQIKASEQVTAPPGTWEFYQVATALGDKRWINIASNSTGEHLAAVIFGGGSGSIYTSTNYGNTWVQRTNGAPADAYWRSIASSSSGQYLAAVSGEAGNVYTSSDYGATWVQRTNGLPLNVSWYSIASSANGQNLVASVYGGFIYTSTNYGASWTQRASNMVWRPVTSSSSGQYLVAAVSDGPIFTSSDYGVTWVQTTAPSLRWQDIISDSTGQYLAASAYNNYIYTSADYGVTWVQRGVQSAWQSVTSSANGQKLAATAEGGYLYTSSDYGVTWTQETHTIIGSPKGWYAIAYSADGSRLGAVVFNGNIYTGAYA